MVSAVSKIEPGTGNHKPEIADGLFWGWFNNQMALLLMLIQCVRPRMPKLLLKIEFFLRDVEHHYLPPKAGASVRGAFRYLEGYFRVYPRVTREESNRAVRMVGRIYAAFGYRFREGDFLKGPEIRSERRQSSWSLAKKSKAVRKTLMALKGFAAGLCGALTGFTRGVSA